MPPPFPGMNPYLEQEDVWQDFHNSVIPIVRRHLNDQLLPGYIATIGTHIYLHELPAEQRRPLGRPDVAVLGTDGRNGGPAAPVAHVSPSIRGMVSLAVDEEIVPFLEIRDRASRNLITAFEILSPSNKKPGGDRDQYIAKRLAYLRGNVNLVEVDLLRGFPRMPAEGLPRCDYVVTVARAAELPAVQFYPIGLRDRLPVIAIPLKVPDADIALDLQAVVQDAFREARYEAYIYESKPTPPLSGEDAEWAARFLPAGMDGA